MKNNLLRALLSIALLATAGAVSAAEVSIDVLDDGGTIALSNPSIAQGPNGNFHIVAQGRDAADISDGSTDELYYLLVSSGGNVRIAATPINTPDTSREGRPRIVATSDNRAVVVWGRSGEPVRYALVDPSGDDQDGDAALPGDILDVTETAVGVTSSNGHLAAAIDSTNVVHVVTTWSSNLRYLSFNGLTGAVVTAEVQLDSSVSNRPNPAIAVDSNDDVHIAYCSNTVGPDGNCPAAYIMLNGATGAVLIDSTQLYTLNESKASHFSIAVDSRDRVHVVFGDKRNNIDAGSYCNECFQGGTAIYMRLDPSADDQDGSAATVSAIQLGDDIELGNVWYGRAFLHNGSMRLIGANGKGGALTYIGSAGALRTVNTNIGGIGWSRHYVDSAGGKVVWSEAVYSPTLAGGTWQLVMSSIGSFAGGGGGGAPGLPLLLAFGLAALARLRRG
jgi:hypothetical protein